MTGQIITRILLVITLIVTAHVIKPFSVRNVTTHLLYSTRSFAFVLPDSARDQFDRVNLLALNFSNSLLDNRQGESVRTAGSAAESNLVAVQSQEQQRTGPVIKRLINKAKIAAKTEVRLAIRKDQGQEDELSGGGTDSSDVETVDEDTLAENNATDTASETAPIALPVIAVFSAAAPVVLPVTHINFVCALSKVRPMKLEHLKYAPILPRLIETNLKLKRSECVQQESKRVKLVALIEAEKGKNPDSQIDRSFASIEDCEEMGTSVADSVADADLTVPKEETTDVKEVIEVIVPSFPPKPENCSLEP